jgi:hypothetical protein
MKKQIYLHFSDHNCTFAHRMKKIVVTKRNFLIGFIVVTLVLAGVKRVAGIDANVNENASVNENESAGENENLTSHPIPEQNSPARSLSPLTSKYNRFLDGKHPIYSVSSFKEEFPDTNALQLTAAEKYGVKPVANRVDAEHRKSELVYIGSNPYYEVRSLSSSIPYLVPRAAVLLQDIGKNFFDSLQVKQIPLHKIMVSSVLRTQEDVAKLRQHNRNATEKSCHLYGTTFDISYTKFQTVSNPAEAPRRLVRDDSLKFVLSEVLRDLRNQKRCYIKHEVKQSCFHITVR